MAWQQHAPFRPGQLAHALFHAAVPVEIAFLAGLAEGVRPGVDRIAQHLDDRAVGGRDPADIVAFAQPHRELQALVAEPQPDAAHGAELGEALENIADRTHHFLVGMEEDFAVLLAPHEADRQGATELAAGGLVADAFQQAHLERVQLGFTDCAFHAQDQAVIETSRVVDAVKVGDQGVGQGAQVDQAVPVGVVASQPGDLQSEHESGAAESDVGGQAVEAVALVGGLAGEAEVLVDDGDLAGVPAQGFGTGGEGVLATRGLSVALDLRGARLADVDEGLALTVGS